MEEEINKVLLNAGTGHHVDPFVEDQFKRHDAISLLPDFSAVISISLSAGQRCQRTVHCPASVKMIADVLRRQLEEGFLAACRQYRGTVKWATLINSKMIWFMIRECVAARGHPLPHDHYRPLQSTWSSRAAADMHPVAKRTFKLCPSVEELRDFLTQLFRVVAPCQWPDKRSKVRKQRSDAGKKRKRDEDEDEQTGDVTPGPKETNQMAGGNVINELFAEVS